MRSGDTDDRALARNTAVVALVVAVVGGAAVAGVTLAAPNPPTGEEILDDAEARYEGATAVVGDATITVENETRTETYELSYAVTDDNESRVSVTGDNGTYVVGSNGSVVWVHDETTGLTRVYDREAMERHANGTANGTEDGSGGAWHGNESWMENASWNATDRQQLYDWTEENRTAERVGTETVDGTEAYVVEVTPADDTEGQVTVWVATESSVVLKQETTGPNGTVTARFESTEFNVSVADSTFQPPSSEAPSLGETVDSFAALQANTSFTVPAVTDERFSFAAGSTVDYGGEVVAIQRYDGPANLTVVSSPSERTLGGVAENATETTLAGTTVNVTETDRGVAVWWSDGELRHGVIADLDRDTVVDIAEELIREQQSSASLAAAPAAAGDA